LRRTKIAEILPARPGKVVLKEDDYAHYTTAKGRAGKAASESRKHWKWIAEHIGRSPSRFPNSLERFSREEAGRILDLLTTVR
jgi:hypothetical protein